MSLLLFAIGLPNRIHQTLIAAEQTETYQTFHNADAFVFMWNDGGSLDAAAFASLGPTAALVQQMQFAHNQLQAVSSGARMIFWGWFHELSVEVFQAGSYAASLAALSSPSLGFPMEYLTESLRCIPLNHSTDPIVKAAGYGFATNDFLYFNNVEDPREMMPHARIAETADEVIAARNSGATGITGYRLSPATRRLNDYVTLRLADDVALPPPPSTSSSAAQAAVTAGLSNFIARGSTGSATTISTVLSSLDGIVALSTPPSALWANYRQSNATSTLIGACQAINAIPASLSPDFATWKSLLGLQLILYLWADTSLAPRDPIVPGVTPPGPSFLDLLRTYVAGKPEYRAFATQPSYWEEADVSLEQFMRRIKEPYGK